MAECARCGRKLKDAKSIEDSMGRVCKKKAMAEKGRIKGENSKVENENRN